MLHWNMKSFELSLKSQIIFSFFMAFIFITNLNKTEKYCSTQNLMKLVTFSQELVLKIQKLYEISKQINIVIKIDLKGKYGD
jgi:hypothetical protein